MRTLLLIIFAALAAGACQREQTAVNSGTPAVIREVSPARAQAEVAKAYSKFVDIRTPAEYAAGHAARSINIPYDTLAASLDRLSKDEPVYLICESGATSKAAAEMMTAAGFQNVMSVAGGNAAWTAAGLPVETQAPHRPQNKK